MVHLYQCGCHLGQSECGPEVSEFFRELADRVDAGEIAHISLSIHPRPGETLEIWEHPVTGEPLR
jgi:hypothetical protein